jgi:hypothetical protein
MAGTRGAITAQLFYRVFNENARSDGSCRRWVTLFAGFDRRRVSMPWKESSVMDERLRFVGRLLEGEPMTDVCRAFGTMAVAVEVCVAYCFQLMLQGVAYAYCAWCLHL